MKQNTRRIVLKCVLPACLALGTAVGCDSTTTTTAPDPEPLPPAEVPTERVVAEAGVGQRGRSLENETGIGGMIAEPAKALFGFEQKAVFDIQIPQAMQLFQATEGRGPDSHEEFMTKIVRANNIRLPELPEGHKYVFDTQSNQLMVERPAN